MNVFGLEVNIKNIPVLDGGYIPMAAFCKAFEASAANGKDLVIAVERNQGYTAVKKVKIHGTEAMQEADRVYVERTVKMLLWA
ncbi:MAG: ROK family protein, partial [Clostridia bacterium]|nr:ROK family protein [Clostridia bacterium]